MIPPQVKLKTSNQEVVVAGRIYLTRERSFLNVIASSFTFNGLFNRESLTAVHLQNSLLFTHFQYYLSFMLIWSHLKRSGSDSVHLCVRLMICRCRKKLFIFLSEKSKKSVESSLSKETFMMCGTRTYEMMEDGGLKPARHHCLDQTAHMDQWLKLSWIIVL